RVDEHPAHLGSAPLVHDGDHLVAHIVQRLDLDLPAIPSRAPLREEAFRSLHTLVDLLLWPAVIVGHVPDEVRSGEVCRKCSLPPEPLEAVSEYLHVLQRHRSLLQAYCFERLRVVEVVSLPDDLATLDGVDVGDGEARVNAARPTSNLPVHTGDDVLA